MGDLPASLAVKSGLPVMAIAVSLPIGASEYLLARPGVTAISQLRGKPVAYTTGTAEQAFALRALHSAGLTQKDVQQVNVTLQELGTALDSAPPTRQWSAWSRRSTMSRFTPTRWSWRPSHGQPAQLRLSARGQRGPG